MKINSRLTEEWGRGSPPLLVENQNESDLSHVVNLPASFEVIFMKSKSYPQALVGLWDGCQYLVYMG